MSGPEKAGTETFAASFPVVLGDFGFDVIALYSSRNDPDPEMIPNPEMIPKSTPIWG